jgi:hypothetical protein
MGSMIGGRPLPLPACARGQVRSEGQGARCRDNSGWEHGFIQSTAFIFRILPQRPETSDPSRRPSYTDTSLRFLPTPVRTIALRSWVFVESAAEISPQSQMLTRIIRVLDSVNNSDRHDRATYPNFD